MAKPIRYVERDIGQTSLSKPFVDDWQVGAIGQKSLTSPQSLPDVPDWARLSESLLKGFIAIKTESNKEELEAGKAKAAQDINKGDFRTAVSEGLIPQGADPYFIAGYRTVMAQRFQNEANTLYEQRVKDRTSEYLASQANHTAAQKPPPDHKQILAEVYDFLGKDLMQGNPTLGNDKYFNSSLADIKLRSLNSMETFGHKYIQEATEKSMLDQFSILGRQGLNDVLDGKMTIEDFNNKFVTGNVHASNIVDTNRFIAGIVTSWYQNELANVDSDGEPANPDKLQKMYSIMSEIKIGNSRLVENPLFSDNYLRLGGSWVKNKTAKQLSDEAWLRQTKDTKSDIYNFVIETDPERKLHKAKDILLLLDTNPEHLGVSDKDVDAISGKIRENYSVFTQLSRPLDQSAEIAEAILLAEKGDAKGARLLAGTLQPHSQILANNGIERAEEGSVKNILTNDSVKTLFSSMEKAAREENISSLPVFINLKATIREDILEQVGKMVIASGDGSPEFIRKTVTELYPLNIILDNIKKTGQETKAFRLGIMQDRGQDNTNKIEEAFMSGKITEDEYTKAKRENNDNLKILTRIRGESGRIIYRSVLGGLTSALFTTSEGGANSTYATMDLNQKIVPNAKGREILSAVVKDASDEILHRWKMGYITDLEQLMANEYTAVSQALTHKLAILGVKNPNLGEAGAALEIESDPVALDPKKYIPNADEISKTKDRLEKIVAYTNMSLFIDHAVAPELRKGMKALLRNSAGMLSPTWIDSSETKGLDLKKLIPLHKLKMFETEKEFVTWANKSANSETLNRVMARFGEASQIMFIMKARRAYSSTKK
jgi:hypothetical protein